MPSRGSSKVPTLPMGNSARSPRSKAAAPRPVPASQVDGPGGKPPREPDPSRIQQFGTYYGLLPVWGWTVEALVSALEGHNVGNFQASGRLAEDMTAHPWIRHGLTVRDEFFTTCPLNFTPAGRTLAEQRRSKRCADFVREIWPDVMPLATLKDLHRHELFMGQGIYAIDWEERRDGRDRWWIPCVKPWEPSLTGYRQFTDPDSIDGGGYTATTLSHGLLRVQPGGGRWGMFSRRTLRPWLGGIVRVLGEAFTGDGYNFRDNMTHQDRWGRGIVKLKYLRSLRTDEVNAATASLVEGGGGGVLQCPVDENGKPLLDADLLRADGAGYQTFDATEKRILRRVLIALLRQDMTTTGTTGIADNDPRQMSLWKCREDDATTYGDARCMTEWEDIGGTRRPIPVWEPCDGALRQHLTRWIAHFNFGEFDLAPYVWWDATPPDDYEQRRDAEAKRGQQRASTLQSLASAVKSFADQGVRCDVAHLADQCGMTLVAPDEDGNVPPEPLKATPKPQGPGGASPPLAGPPPAALPPASGRPGAAGKRAETREDATRDVETRAPKITGDDLSGIQVRISAAGAPFHAGHTPGVGPHGEIGLGGAGGSGTLASGGQQLKIPSTGGSGAAGGGGGESASKSEGKTLYDATGGGAGKSPMAVALHHEEQAKNASLDASMHRWNAEDAETAAEAHKHASLAEAEARKARYHHDQVHSLIGAEHDTAKSRIDAEMAEESATAARAAADKKKATEHAAAEEKRRLVETIGRHTAEAQTHAASAQHHAAQALASPFHSVAQAHATEAEQAAAMALSSAQASGMKPEAVAAHSVAAEAARSARKHAYTLKAVDAEAEASRHAGRAATAQTVEEAQHHANKAAHQAQVSHEAAMISGDPRAIAAARSAAEHAAVAENHLGRKEHEQRTRMRSFNLGQEQTAEAKRYATLAARYAEHAERAESASHAQALADTAADYRAQSRVAANKAKEHFKEAKRLDPNFDYDSHASTADNAATEAAAHHARAVRAVEKKRAEEAKPVIHVDDATRFFGERHGITRETLAETFSSTGVFKATGGSFSNYGDTYRASFNLVGNDGRRVGSIVREFRKDASGNISVYHSYFELEDSRLQGSGAAKDVFRKSVQMYERIGVKEITVTAGLSKGRYVWASYGFEAHKSEVDDFRDRFQRHLRQALQSASIANDEKKHTLLREAHEKAHKIKSMQDLADFEHGGEKLGKNWLLNVGDSVPMWHGKVTIGPRSKSLKRLKEKIGLTTPSAPRRRRVKNVDTTPQNG